MPTFNFLDTETNEVFEDFLTNSRKQDLLEKNPHIKQLPNTFGIVTITGSLDSKTDNTWKEVLSKISEAHPESELANRYGDKSSKQIKTKEILNKYRSRWKTL